MSVYLRSAFLAGFSAFVFFLFTQLNRRMDRLEVRMGRQDDSFVRLEDKLDQISERVNSLDVRVSKLEWMLDAALYGKDPT